MVRGIMTCVRMVARACEHATRGEGEKSLLIAHTRTSTYRLINSTIKFRNQNSSTCDFVCMDWLNWFLGPVDTVIAAGAQRQKTGRRAGN